MTLADCILYGGLEAVERAVAAGADVNEVDEYGYTPLIEAAIVHSLEVTEYLLAKGAHINAKDMTGRTALFWAVDNHNIPLVNLLIAHGAETNVYTHASQPLLVNPLLRNQPTLKNILYENKANLDVAKDYINTKLLGHRFHLKGKIFLLNHKKHYMKLDVEGFFLEFTLNLVRQSLERFAHHFVASQLQSYRPLLTELIDAYQRAAYLIRYQHYTLDERANEKHIVSLLNHKLVLLPIAYEGHAVTFVKYGHYWVKIDRGENSLAHGSINIYKIRDMFTLSKSFYFHFLYEKHDAHYVHEAINKTLSLKPLMQIPISSQTSGNCSWANVEAAMSVMLFLLLLGESPAREDVAACEKQALEIYAQWQEWDRDDALDQCIAQFNEYKDNAYKAMKAVILGQVLFQACDYHNLKDVQRAEKILAVLTQPDYQFVLVKLLELYCNEGRTPYSDFRVNPDGARFLTLLDHCDIDLDSLL